MTHNDKVYDSLKDLQGKYVGERIFVIGNGPSLSETPLDKIGAEYSFALNRVNLVYESVEWRPHFYTFIKNSMNEEEQKMVEKNIELGCICFLNKKYRERLGDHDNVFYIQRRKLYQDPLSLATFGKPNIEEVEIDALTHYWSEDITQGVYKQHSMYPLLQIVGYLGFDEVYLLGCDLGFEVQKPYMLFSGGLDPSEFRNKSNFLTTSIKEKLPIRSAINGFAFKIMRTWPSNYILRRSTNLYEDNSHFTESYDGKIRFTDVNEQISNAHRVAKKILNENDVEVHNATLGGELEVYPRIDLEQLIN